MYTWRKAILPQRLERAPVWEFIEVCKLWKNTPRNRPARTIPYSTPCGVRFNFSPFVCGIVSFSICAVWYTLFLLLLVRRAMRQEWSSSEHNQITQDQFRHRVRCTPVEGRLFSWSLDPKISILPSYRRATDSFYLPRSTCAMVKLQSSVLINLILFI